MDNESVGDDCNQCEEGENHPVERSSQVRRAEGLGWVNQPTRSIGDTTENISL